MTIRQRLSSREFWIDAIAMAFILLFTYTALSKLFLYRINLYDLGRSPMLGPYARFLSFFIPGSELAVSVMLFLPRTRKYGFYIAFLMMAVFTWYVWYILKYFTNLPCTCGGIIRNLTWHQHLIFNIVFTALAALGIWLEWTLRRRNSKTATLSFN